MRAYLASFAGAAVVLGGSAQAAPRTKTVRSVQLIAMGSSGQPSFPGASEVNRTGQVSHLDADVSFRFRVHDLSRRWVEHQMAASLASAPAMQPAENGDAFAPFGVAQPPVADDPVMAAPIAVPPWMRGGATFAAAATRYVPSCSVTAYRPTGFLKSDAEYRRASYYGMMSHIACQYGIPVGLFDAMIIRESRYQPDIYSPKNAFGLTQLMPGTAASLGVNRYNVEENLRGGAKYLRQQLGQFGQYHLALAAYNAGPGRVRNGRVPRIAETQAYVDNVLLNWSRLSGLAQPAFAAARPVMSAGQPSIGRIAAVSTF